MTEPVPNSLGRESIPAADGQLILLFDGYCGFCSGFVAFVRTHDRRSCIRYETLQSEFAGPYLQKIGNGFGDTMICVHRGEILTKSSAALCIFGKLAWPWRGISFLWIVPLGLRDRIYDFVGRNRYRWFGRNETCAIPPERGV